MTNTKDLEFRAKMIKLHRKLWKRIAELIESGYYERDPIMYKKKAIAEVYGSMKVESYCFCCEYDHNFYDDCSHCPIVWYVKNSCDESEYGDFWDSIEKRNWVEAAWIARIIADLPERKFEDE